MRKNVLNFTDEAKTARKYGKRGETSLSKFTSSNNRVFGTLTIDTRRSNYDYGVDLPVAARIAYGGKTIYLRIGKRYKKEDWMDLCECEKLGRNKRSLERKELKSLFLKVEALVNQMIDENVFTLPLLQDRFGAKNKEGRTIYNVWEKYIQDKMHEGKVGTARSNADTKNRFEKDLGKNISFDDVNKKLILKWKKKMSSDRLSSTTIGIFLRTFRAIVNVCIAEGLIKGDTREMFKETGYNKSNSRKHEFLDVPTMKRLYDFWVNGEAKDEYGEEKFLPREKNAIFRDLGLFLFMYLGDGQNLADTLRLTYDEWYFSTNHRQLRFYRHKTHDRNENASEVIFPITPELQQIIDRYGSEPRMGRRVFPIMSELLSPMQEVEAVKRYNRYIRNHMKKVAELLNIEQKPSPTWARHSFATNLNNSGRVPYKYISDSMGHSGSGDVTSNYIGAYPLEKMLEYNGYLLKDSKPANGKAALLDLLRGMNAEERAALMVEVEKE